ncbi:MAG: pyrroline-5-carboxylate reductase [Bdellovibrionota bacterium]
MKETARHTWKDAIAVIGAGNMGAALAAGFCRRLGVDPKKVFVYDTDSKKTERLRKELGLTVASTPAQAVERARIVVLAIKPKLVDPVLKSLRRPLAARSTPALVVSVAAGVTVSELRSAAGKKPHIVRVMPNLACSIGVGTSAICGADPSDVALVEQMFQTVGGTVVLGSEVEMDAATALGASAPAFIFHIVEALADGGVKMGLTREQALSMATQMTLGSAELIKQTGKHPAELKDMVASPGGTTIAGIHVLEKGAVRGAMMSAIEAAALKAAQRRQK